MCFRIQGQVAYSVEIVEHPDGCDEPNRMMSWKFSAVRDQIAFHAGSVKDAMRFTEEERARLSGKK